MNHKAMVGAALLVGVLGISATGNALELFPMPKLKIAKGATSSGNLVSGSGYSIQNTQSGSFLGDKTQRFGEDLGWHSTQQETISLEKQGGGTINFGDMIAVKFAKCGYLKYQSRDYGINLHCSKTPVFEWQITGGTGPVQLGQPVSLFNTVEKQPMTYCWRKYGVWLKWENTCSQKDLAAAKAGVPSL
jgi:hypothetical protein